MGHGDASSKLQVPFDCGWAALPGEAVLVLGPWGYAWEDLG